MFSVTGYGVHSLHWDFSGVEDTETDSTDQDQMKTQPYGGQGGCKGSNWLRWRPKPS